MKKIHYFGLLLITMELSSCTMMIGNVFRLGFKMGIWSVVLLVGLFLWIISKKNKNRR